MRRTQSLSHWISLILVTAVTLILLGFFLQTELRLTGGEPGVPLDDAWIHYQFARNLSQGNGFSYNPGQPTPGSTAPLWTLLLAGVGLFTEAFVVPSLVLSAGFLLVAVWLGYGFTFSLTCSRLAALLAALALAFTGRLLWAGLAGMETTAFAAFSLAAVWAYTRQGLRPLPALLFGLASQLRPEGHALFGLALLDVAWVFLVAEGARNRRWLAPALRRFLPALLIYGLVAAPYALFSLATTGKPLPNTFYAKVGSEHFFSWRTLRETATLHWTDNPVSLLLVPVGLWALWRRGRLAVLWLLSLPLLTAVVVDFVWHHGRYTMPLIPFQMIVAAAGAHWLWHRQWPGRQEPEQTKADSSLRLSGSWLMIVLGLLLLAGGWWQLPNWATMLGHNSEEILEVDVALGHWLAQNTPPDALVAVDDIGAITFLSQRRIVDLNGLVSPQMWPALRQPVGLPRNQVATRILSRLQPDYMVAFPLWHWEIVTNPTVTELVHRARTDTHTIIAEQEAVVYRTTWPYRSRVSPQVVREVMLGDAIRLLGYDFRPPEPGEQPLALTLYWQSVESVSVAYDVFVHVLDEEGQIVAQADREPVGGLASTLMWQPGDIIRDPYRLELPSDLAASTYTVQAGMYLRQTGARLPVGDEQATNDAIPLVTFSWR